jgi:hypothetical protein
MLGAQLCEEGIHAGRIAARRLVDRNLSLERLEIRRRF